MGQSYGLADTACQDLFHLLDGLEGQAVPICGLFGGGPHPRHQPADPFASGASSLPGWRLLRQPRNARKTKRSFPPLSFSKTKPGFVWATAG